MASLSLSLSLSSHRFFSFFIRLINPRFKLSIKCNFSSAGNGTRCFLKLIECEWDESQVREVEILHFKLSRVCQRNKQQNSFSSCFNSCPVRRIKSLFQGIHSVQQKKWKKGEKEALLGLHPLGLIIIYCLPLCNRPWPRPNAFWNLLKLLMTFEQRFARRRTPVDVNDWKTWKTKRRLCAGVAKMIKRRFPHYHIKAKKKMKLYLIRFSPLWFWITNFMFYWRGWTADTSRGWRFQFKMLFLLMEKVLTSFQSWND